MFSFLLRHEFSFILVQAVYNAELLFQAAGINSICFSLNCKKHSPEACTTPLIGSSQTQYYLFTAVRCCQCFINKFIRIMNVFSKFLQFFSSSVLKSCQRILEVSTYKTVVTKYCNLFYISDKPENTFCYSTCNTTKNMEKW